MNSEINLVSNTNDRLEKEKRILLILRAIAVSMLVTLALVAVLLFIVSTQFSVSQVKKEENNVISSITSLSNRLALYSFSKDRINNINNILSLRKDYAKPISTIYEKTYGSLKINGLTIKTNILTINISSNSLTEINKFINDLADLTDQKKIIKKLTFESLSLDSKNGNYSINLKMDLL